MTGDQYSGLPPWTWRIEPAPGDLRIVQAFVNTLDIETGVDTLEDPAALAKWLLRWRLAKRKPLIAPQDWEQALALREGLRELLIANCGCDSDQRRLDDLSQALREIPLRLSIDPPADFCLLGGGNSWQDSAASILTIVARAMADGSWSLLKACRRTDCQWAFFDFSKNHSGKWCSMEGCGNLMKARAYRQRRRREAD